MNNLSLKFYQIIMHFTEPCMFVPLSEVKLSYIAETFTFVSEVCVC